MVAPPKRPAAAVRPRLFLRFEFGGDDRVGPGKIALLEAIERERSISAAARAMGMSYRRAWLLVDTMNRMFREPVVVARPGRASVRSADVTAFGARLVAAFRDAEARTQGASRALVDELVASLRPGYRPPPGRKRGRS
ncbi:MAG: winged helix-turn-helix domain-containing protein [Burkholderiales bacterium]|nr:winged helix-turn-helix domain-containing protein [Burkholderiales bacterium]